MTRRLRKLEGVVAAELRRLRSRRRVERRRDERRHLSFGLGGVPGLNRRQGERRAQDRRRGMS